MAGAGYKLFVNGNALSASDLNTYVQQQTVMVFASASARTTALSGVLAEGMVSYRTDSHVFEVYNGTSWVSAGASSPLTTKGDLWGYSTTDARVPVGTDGQALLADSTQTAGLRWGSASVTLQEQIFTSSGTWTAPAGVTKVWLLVVGGGGGGCGGVGAGGMGGAQTQQQFTVSPSTGYTVTIGAGGTGVGGGGYIGGTGGTSSFSTVTGLGGYGGQTNGNASTLGGNSYGIGSNIGNSAAGANTGGGGGGANGGTAGNGGSGIVIVRWLA